MSLFLLLRSTVTALVYQSQATKYYTEWWIIERSAALVTCTHNLTCNRVEFWMIGDILSSVRETAEGYGLKMRFRFCLIVVVPSSCCQFPFTWTFLVIWDLLKILSFLTLDPHQSIHMNTQSLIICIRYPKAKCQHTGLYWQQDYWSLD